MQWFEEIEWLKFKYILFYFTPPSPCQPSMKIARLYQFSC